jgi:hypothetical protein
MFYVGLDIHAKHISISALNENGRVAHRSRVRSIEEMMQILMGLPDRFEVCYAAVAARSFARRNRDAHLPGATD